MPFHLFLNISMFVHCYNCFLDSKVEIVYTEQMYKFISENILVNKQE